MRDLATRECQKKNHIKNVILIDTEESLNEFKKLFGEHSVLGFRERTPSAKAENMRKHSPGFYTSNKRIRSEERLNIVNLDGEIILTYDETKLEIQIEMIYDVVVAHESGLVRSIQQEYIQMFT